MKKTMLILAAAALAASCTTLVPPEGYAVRRDAGSRDLLAVSTDASALSLRVLRNEDPKAGTLAYWAEAAKKQLTLSRGYTSKEEGSFTTAKGPGRWFLFSQQHRGTEHLYLLGLVVKGKRIYALEAGGEAALLADDVPHLVESFSTLR
ncbi:MAG: hypothetical protein FJ098_14830 [Deltaproteobacteria bacterium]|nr:hypothetical protein [Deltaproteobacteria bacterium]